MKYQRYAVLVLLFCLIGWIGIPVKASLQNTIAFEGINSITIGVIAVIGNNVKLYTKDKIENYINGVIYASLRAKLPSSSVKVIRYSASSASEKSDTFLRCNITVAMRQDGLYYGYISLKLDRLVSIPGTGKVTWGILYESGIVFSLGGDLEDLLRSDAEHLVQDFIIDFYEARPDL